MYVCYIRDNKSTKIKKIDSFFVSLIEEHNGTININLLEKFTSFEIIFGLIDNFDNVAKLGITMGRKIIDTLKRSLNLHSIAVGISTGKLF